MSEQGREAGDGYGGKSVTALHARTFRIYHKKEEQRRNEEKRW